MIYFTEIENLPVYDVTGAYIGQIVDLGIDPDQNALLVAAYFVKTPDKTEVHIFREQMQAITVRSAQTSVSRSEIHGNRPVGDLLRARKDVLDQQVIDVNHRK